MKRHLAFVAATLLLACVAYGRDGVNSETIRLRNIGPDNVAEALKMQQGIEQLTLNYRDNSVTVRGDEKALLKFKSDLRRLDIEFALYWVKMRLVRYRVDASGKHTETVVMASSVSTLANAPVSCSQLQNESGYSAFATVRQNDDSTMNLTSEVRELGDEGEIVSSGKNIRNVKLGETTRSVGMTDAKDKAVRRAVHHGEIVNNPGEYNSYYLDVKIEARSTTGK